METITDGGRRTLPPVPRSAAARDTRPPVPRRPPVPSTVGAPQGPTARIPGPAGPRDDPGQAFVTALRAAAAGFATAAGTLTAVVAEAVPPARHRRARCRVVLLAADGTESAATFLGTAGD